MTQEFYQIYELLYADYVYDIGAARRQDFRLLDFNYIELDLVRQIRRNIDISNTDNKLRPDAKYFLLVNFHNLILRPLLEIRPNTNIQIAQNLGSLIEAIQQDIFTIVSETIAITDDREVTISREEQISGHQIMLGIDRVWRNLKTTKFEIWG